MQPPNGGSDEGGTPALRLVRLLKPLRLLKMGKVLKIMNLGAIMRYMESSMGIPHETFRMMVTFCAMFGVIHISACFFWWVKENTNSPEDLRDFLTGKGIDPGATNLDNIHQKYGLACYFIVTCVTTVGFGDISATNAEEQLFCMLIMLTGALVFAKLMSTVQSIQANMSRMHDLVEARVAQAREYLQSKGVPPEIERKVLAWIEFDVVAEAEFNEGKEFLKRLPPLLLREILMIDCNTQLDSVAFLRQYTFKDRSKSTWQH
jgi:hypothetical protein